MDVVHLLSFRDCSGASSLQCLAFFLTLLENGIATGESREEVIFFPSTWESCLMLERTMPLGAALSMCIWGLDVSDHGLRNSFTPLKVAHSL